MIISEEQVRNLILLQPEKTFSQILMTTSSEYITQRLGNEGYTFAEVQGYPQLDSDNNKTDVTF
ncbi:MAG: hypothetical protein CM15mP51_19940 [Porticoccaceae bacterium]|nr:MAG: hypothetical protein CM15mP51_19940 [Porticoccaceae bacterium]